MYTDGDIKNVAPSHTQSFCYMLEIQLAQEHSDFGTVVFRTPGDIPLVGELSIASAISFLFRTPQCCAPGGGTGFFTPYEVQAHKTG